MTNEKLVAMLRNCATEAAPCKTCGLVGDGSCSDYLMKQAADAIEELSKRVPKKPHGRLIDADALGVTLEKLAADKWNHKVAPASWSDAFAECLEMIDDAPTVIEQNFINAPATIEAEEGET